MGDRARKKERHRMKRKEKQLARRRQQSVSPYRRIGASGELEHCLINPDWQERGQAVVYVLRRMPGGASHAMATFMIDLWCAGLKDAWGRLDISRDEFDDAVDQMAQHMDFEDEDWETVRDLIAGSIRFAVQNGFRLPAHYERWTTLAGGVGDWASADLSDFGWEEGKLHWVGPMHDLRRRLIGSSVEDFLKRPDVEFTTDVDVFGEEVEEDEDAAAVNELDDYLAQVQEKALDAVRRWCFATNQQPHPRLPEALDLLFTSIEQTRELAQADEAEAASEEVSEEAHQHIGELLATESPQAADELRQAIDQLAAFMQQFPTPDAMIETLGLEMPEDEDEAEDEDDAGPADEGHGRP